MLNIYLFHMWSLSPAVCLVMEFMWEGSLRDLLKKKFHFGEREVAVVAFSVLMGLCEMHALNLIHRDIKVCPG